MNPEKFTHKTNETIATAHELAGALISDPTGIFLQAISSTDSENATQIKNLI
ncbi:hypothetical protein AXX17_AT4G01800 [Arabidopsis thaliana]|uniref:Uncharacterized protein n=1 Tax=Arabidopsis thaliana TaxID=3702 RepID=A0A178V6G1_ARATH|nr:hypothetical protein AXX17_AT4G01800 [Arabidopsis thaliana]